MHRWVLGNYRLLSKHQFCLCLQVQTYLLLLRENPKGSIIKLLKLINDFNKVVGYKINTQISAMFLKNSNVHSEKEINEAMPLTTATEK